MATSTSPRDQRAEAREFLRASQKRNAELRQSVLRQVANLERLTDKRRAASRT